MERYLVGLDVGGTNVKMALMTDALVPIDFFSLPTVVSDGYEVISERMIRQIELLCSQNGIPVSAIAAIGMGLPGTVDVKNQLTSRLALMQWDNMNPCKKIADHFGVSCAIENDANLNTLGEYWFGVQKSVDNLVLLTLGTGVGGGIILGGRLYGGSSNLAGEFGHMTIVSDCGRTCLCGQRGHFEAYSSGTALATYVSEHLSEHPSCVLHGKISAAGSYDNRMLFEGLAEKDDFCRETFDQYVRYLSIGCANIMKLFAPDLLVLAGGIAKAGDVLFDALCPQVRENLLDERQYCPIVPAKAGVRAGAYGACILASQLL